LRRLFGRRSDWSQRQRGQFGPEELVVRWERSSGAPNRDPVFAGPDLQALHINPFIYLRDVIERVSTPPAWLVLELTPRQ
jgi:hypothetical protein